MKKMVLQSKETISICVFTSFCRVAKDKDKAQIKLLDVWKSKNCDAHPTKWLNRNDTNSDLRTRAADANKLIEAHGSKILTSTFYSDAAKVWNNAPDCIKQCQSVYAVKKQIKQYITSLPI